MSQYVDDLYAELLSVYFETQMHTIYALILLHILQNF